LYFFKLQLCNLKVFKDTITVAAAGIHFQFPVANDRIDLAIDLRTPKIGRKQSSTAFYIFNQN
jgi:hypothetical protein